MITELKKITKELLCDHDFVVVKSFKKGEFKKDILKCSSCGKKVSTDWVKYPQNVIFLNRNIEEKEDKTYKHQSR